MRSRNKFGMTVQLIICDRVSPAFFEAKFLVEIEGGRIFFLYKEDGLFAGTEGAVAECLNQGSCIAISAVKRVGVNSANLHTVDSYSICVSLGYNIAIEGKGKAELIF